MKVSDLAEELGLPPSAVLDQCQRFGIDAGWAGAELSGADLVVLRAELANAEDPIDLRPADAGESAAAAEGDDGDAAVVTVVESEAAPVDAGPAVPPTAVSSMPEAAGAPAVEPEPAGGGFRMAGMTGAAPPVTTIQRKPEEERRKTEARVDHSVRTAIFALVVGVVALGAAELLRNAWSIWALWLLGAAALLIALWNANMGRRHVTTHPEKAKGLVLSVAAMVLAVGGLVVVGTSAYASIGDAPAADAPLGLGNRESVASARWGYQRLRRVASEGWNRPAKDAGTCWSESASVERDPQRIESGTVQEPCGQAHSTEIIDVYAYDRDADSAYPGREALQADVQERCGDAAERALNPSDGQAVEGLLFAEVPTRDGWANADHDVACAIVTATRQGRLADS